MDDTKEKQFREKKKGGKKWGRLVSSTLAHSFAVFDSPLPILRHSPRLLAGENGNGYIKSSGGSREGALPLISRPNWGPKGRKKNLRRSPLLSQGLDDQPPPASPPSYQNVWIRHWKVGERGTEGGGKVELGFGFPFSSSIPRAVSLRSLLCYSPFFGFTKESGPRLSFEWFAGYTWCAARLFWISYFSQRVYKALIVIAG